MFFSFFFKYENWLFPLLKKHKQLLFFALLFALSTPLFSVGVLPICGNSCGLFGLPRRQLRNCPVAQREPMHDCRTGSLLRLGWRNGRVKGRCSAIAFFGLSGGAVATVFIVVVALALALVAALFAVAGVVLLAARAVVFAPVFFVAPFLAVPVVAAFVARAEGDSHPGAGHVDAHVAQVDVDVGGLGAEGGCADEQGQKQGFHGVGLKKVHCASSGRPMSLGPASLDGQDGPGLQAAFLQSLPMTTSHTPAYTRAQALPATLQRRIVILDGAMGTMIQRFKLTEAQYRGERFADFHKDVKGNNELLSLTRPDVIADIHERYLAAGADLIETNTFGATTVAQEDYDMAHLAREMNVASARIARAACDKFSTPDHPRYVAGALGPTPKTASISPDVNDPGARNVTFEQLRAAYYEQIDGLVEGGADVLLVETIFDTLNAKAALFAIEEFFDATGHRLPVIISGTVTDASGRILSGQTVTAFWASVRHIQPLAVGLNCALGATLMRPYIQELAKAAPDTFISCYPNAGLPNPMSDTGFDETPDVTSRLVHEFAAEGLVNIVGGCCGTTPDHIAAIASAVRPEAPRAAGKLFYPAEA